MQMSRNATQPIWIPKAEKRREKAEKGAKGQNERKTMEEKLIIAGTDV